MQNKGIPGTYDGIHRNIIRESSGNPKAINDWDINAINGIPRGPAPGDPADLRRATTWPAPPGTSTTRSPTSPPRATTRPTATARSTTSTARTERPLSTAETPTRRRAAPRPGCRPSRVVRRRGSRLLAHDLGLVAAQEAGHEEAADHAERRAGRPCPCPRRRRCARHSGSASPPSAGGLILLKSSVAPRRGDRPAGRHQVRELVDADRAVQREQAAGEDAPG